MAGSSKIVDSKVVETVVFPCERTNEVSFTLRRKEMKIMNKTIAGVSFVKGIPLQVTQSN